MFNGAKHISDAFGALSEQTYGSYEAIFVVDRKTTDNSLELIKAQMSRIPEVKVIIQEEDTKLGGARNEGLRVAGGEIIWFMDIDDAPLPDLLEYTVSVMGEKGADIVMFNSIRSFSRDISIPDRRYRVDEMNRKNAIMALLDLDLPVTAWSKIIRKDLLTDNRIEFSTGYAEDVEHTYLTVDRAEKVCFCEKPLYIYIQSEGSICNTDKNRNLRGRAELEKYQRLEDLFSGDAEIIGRFKKRSAIIRMRSAVHMDKGSFMEYAKSEECRSMLKRNLRGSVSPEVLLFRAAPSLYYSFVSYYLRKIYYKDKKYFRSPRGT